MEVIAYKMQYSGVKVAQEIQIDCIPFEEKRIWKTIVVVGNEAF